MEIVNQVVELKTKPCPKCKGTGKDKRTTAFGVAEIKCHGCHGTGEVPDEGLACLDCGVGVRMPGRCDSCGSGRVVPERQAVIQYGPNWRERITAGYETATPAESGAGSMEAKLRAHMGQRYDIRQKAGRQKLFGDMKDGSLEPAELLAAVPRLLAYIDALENELGTAVEAGPMIEAVKP